MLYAILILSMQKRITIGGNKISSDGLIIIAANSGRLFLLMMVVLPDDELAVILRRSICITGVRFPYASARDQSPYIILPRVLFCRCERMNVQVRYPCVYIYACNCAFID